MVPSRTGGNLNGFYQKIEISNPCWGYQWKISRDRAKYRWNSLACHHWYVKIWGKDVNFQVSQWNKKKNENLRKFQGKINWKSSGSKNQYPHHMQLLFFEKSQSFGGLFIYLTFIKADHLLCSTTITNIQSLTKFFQSFWIREIGKYSYAIANLHEQCLEGLKGLKKKG